MVAVKFALILIYNHFGSQPDRNVKEKEEQEEEGE